VPRQHRSVVSCRPDVEASIGEAIMLDAIALYRLARRRGLTVRSSVDCLIAACALRHDLEVLHRDRDFSALAQISDLRERQA
jgi:predicted nucleic acid-binding protein